MPRLHTRQSLLAHLDAVGVAHRTYDHAPVFTVAESGAVKDAIPGGHTKNLFLKDKKGRLVLLSALADTVIDITAFSRAIGAARFSFGSAELLEERLGVTPGSVTAFALINDPDRTVAFYLDAALLAHDPINFHPLRNDATTAISPAGLARYLESLGRPLVAVDFRAPADPRLIDAAAIARHLPSN